jgi:hypothetical protein
VRPSVGSLEGLHEIARAAVASGCPLVSIKATIRPRAKLQRHFIDHSAPERLESEICPSYGRLATRSIRGMKDSGTDFALCRDVPSAEEVRRSRSSRPVEFSLSSRHESFPLSLLRGGIDHPPGDADCFKIFGYPHKVVTRKVWREHDTTPAKRVIEAINRRGLPGGGSYDSIRR